MLSACSSSRHSCAEQAGYRLFLLLTSSTAVMLHAAPGGTEARHAA